MRSPTPIAFIALACIISQAGTASAKVIRLDRIGAFPVSQRKAAQAVLASVLEQKENPKSFFANVELTKAGMLSFYLIPSKVWFHRNSKQPIDPGGHGARTVTVNPTTGEIVETLYEQ